MRAAFALIAALVVTACQVNVEGAPCSTPGQTTDCPGGQACGNDRKCSERAAACAATRCDVGTSRCTGSGATLAAETCVAIDSACSTWQVDVCGTRGLVCASGGTGAYACACPVDAGAEFAADPNGSTLSAAIAPTGVAQPVQCRFSRLGEALAAAGAYPGAATVRAYGDAGTSVVFGAATGETYPVEVPANTTLLGATGASDTTISGDTGSSASVVTVRGVLQGVRVTNVSMTGTGVDVVCGGTGMPTLRDVVVSAAGTQKFATGVAIAGACGATLQRVDVSGASGAALDIAATAITAAVTVSGSQFHLSGTGVHASGGKLVFQSDGTTPSQVTDNAGGGINVGGTGAVDVTLTGVIVARNGGTGVVIGSVPAATSALKMTNCDVHSNATASPTQYGPAPKRNAGGILLLPAAPLAQFQMQGNQVYANHGGTFGADEIAFENGTGWMLTTGSCATANAIGCVGTGYSVSVVNSGTVNAQFTTWPGLATAASGFVDASNACTPPWSATCP